VRIYAVAMAAGVAVALSVFATFGLPILIEGITRALTDLTGGLRDADLPRILDSTAIITVEGGLQVIFLVTFYRRHRHRFRKDPGKPRPDARIE
jgi:hypothetical protein